MRWWWPRDERHILLWIFLKAECQLVQNSYNAQCQWDDDGGPEMHVLVLVLLFFQKNKFYCLLLFAIIRDGQKVGWIMYLCMWFSPNTTHEQQPLPAKPDKWHGKIPISLYPATAHSKFAISLNLAMAQSEMNQIKHERSK